MWEDNEQWSPFLCSLAIFYSSPGTVADLGLVLGGLLFELAPFLFLMNSFVTRNEKKKTHTSIPKGMLGTRKWTRDPLFHPFFLCLNMREIKNQIPCDVTFSFELREKNFSAHPLESGTPSFLKGIGKQLVFLLPLTLKG